MIRSALRRPILITCGILGVAAAGAAAMHTTTSWSPVDAFLEFRSAPETQQAALMDATTASGLRSGSRTPFAEYQPSAVGSGSVPTGGEARALGTGKASGASSWAADHLHGAYSAGGAGPSAAAGNLWRLMGLAHGRSEAATTASTHAATPRQPKAPKPPKEPHNSSGHGGGATVTTPPASAPLTTAPVLLIGGDPASVGLPAATSGGPSTGAFAPGAGHVPNLPTVGHVGHAAGGMAATPEPASFLLLGTGLLGFGWMRRRRP